MDKAPENWNKLSRLEKARWFASSGNSNSVVWMTLEGVLDELPEVEQRKIVAEAYNKSAELADSQNAQGIYPKAAFEDPEFALATEGFSRRQRAKAIEILWNPEGKGLKDQLKEFSQPKK